jgi:hypothetical protein
VRASTVDRPSAVTALLLISTKKEREGFIRKLVNEAVPKDTSVVAFQTGGSCETLEKLGMKDACKAILLEKGEVRREVIFQDDDVKDSIALMKMLYEKEKEPEEKLEEIGNKISKFKVEKGEKHIAYCLKCKTKTILLNPEIERRAKGLMVHGTCSNCGNKKVWGRPTRQPEQ